MSSLYLIRHADALDTAPDAFRALSPLGRRQIGRVTDLLRDRAVLRPSVVWHSPLVRARETAELLAKGLDWRATFTELPALEPDEPPGALLPRIESNQSKTIAIVGHEPFLSALAAILVTGEPWPPIVAMPKSSVLALEQIEVGLRSPWVVAWHLTPTLLGEIPG